MTCWSWETWRKRDTAGWEDGGAKQLKSAAGFRRASRLIAQGKGTGMAEGEYLPPRFPCRGSLLAAKMAQQGALCTAERLGGCAWRKCCGFCRRKKNESGIATNCTYCFSHRTGTGSRLYKAVAQAAGQQIREEVRVGIIRKPGLPPWEALFSGGCTACHSAFAREDCLFVLF